jgi:hypothetical protein
MSDRQIDITRRKMLGALGAVGAAGAGAGMGTSALFGDTELFEQNTLAAGELDLKVDWEEHYSYPQLYGFSDPTDGLDVTRSEPDDTSDYVGLPDPDDPVVWVHEDDLGAYMSNTAIEAFPDPDNDGEQEVEAGSFTYEPCNDGADLPSGLESLHSGGSGNPVRTNNDDTTDDAGNAEPLIKLEDVKPGDFGEFTFSFHLCDNPGYVWLQAANFNEDGGANPESEGANEANLAENIQTVWWYDARGDNIPPRTDCEEKLYLTDTDSDYNNNQTVLFEVDLSGGTAELTELLPAKDSTINNGNFDETDAIAATPNGNEVVLFDKESEHIGVYDVGNESFTDNGATSGTVPGGVVLAGYSPSGTLWAASQDDNKLYTVDPNTPSFTEEGDTGINLSGADLAFASDGTMYLWSGDPTANGLYEVVDPASDTTAVAVGSVGDKDTNVTGMAIRSGGNGNIVVSNKQDDEIRVVDRTNGNLGASFPTEFDEDDDGTLESWDLTSGDMTAGILCGEVFRRGNPEIEGSPENLKDDITALESSPVPLDGNRATGFDEFDESGDEADRECFPAGVTHYIGFGWWLPADVGNEVQGDSVSFDLGFYTEQCENNDGSYSGP